MRTDVLWMGVFALGACGDDGGSSQVDAPTQATVPSWRDPALVMGIAAAAEQQPGAVVRDDGLEIIFSSTRAGGPACGNLWRATRASATAAWGTPELLAGVNDASCEGSPALSPDGLELLFNRASETAPTSKIYRASRGSSNDPFGTPTEATELNVAAFALSPSLSGDGLTVVFQAGATPGGGAVEVYQAERSSASGAFGAPHKLAELGALSIGIGLSPDGLFLLAYSGTGERFAHYARPSTSGTFGTSTLIGGIVPEPMYKALSWPFIVRGSGDLYYTRRNATNNVEIWSAVRE